MAPDVSISEEDWNQTPPAVRMLLGSLLEQVESLAEANEALQAEVNRLREQLGQNSQNSSRPPSSDPPDTPQRRRKPSGRRRGGQPGHKGRTRKLIPIEEVDEVIPVKPAACQQCGHPLEGEDPEPRRHQVTEIPPIEPETTEYQLHTLDCSCCGASTSAELPVGVPARSFGPRVQAMVSVLSGKYRMTKRNIEELMTDCFGVALALGSVSNLEQATGGALEEPVAEAKAYVAEQPVVNVDETGWREANGKAWLWVAVTGWVTVFVIRLSRGGQVVKELLGADFEGIVGSDRWSAYNWLDVVLRQLCWAHLRRDFQAFVDRGGESARMGQELLAQADLMFQWWYRVRDGTLTRADFQEKMQEVQTRVGELLREGTVCDHAKTAGTCRHILRFEDALWTFVRVEGVEPTNNAAEQAVRPGVLWRKGSFGTQSQKGSRFVERMMTVVATLKRQDRNVLDYVTAACQAAISGETPPSLIPSEAMLSELCHTA
jgi:transposase